MTIKNQVRPFRDNSYRPSTTSPISDEHTSSEKIPLYETLSRQRISAEDEPTALDAGDGDRSQAQLTPQDEYASNLYRPRTLKFWSVILSINISMFLVALDRTVIATAIPSITDEFKSLGDIGWYGSAYMLATASFQLVFGRIYSFFDLRRVFLISIIIFEAGSALCGAAPSSIAFIIGRAISGLGSAGISTGSMMTIIPMVPLHKRPMYQSMFGMIFGIASVCGPIIGGALTEKATWRWCFYVNLPFGAVAFACLYFFNFPDQLAHGLPIKKRLLLLDPVGTFFFIPSVACLLLALQWGGSKYPWNSWRIIILFLFFGLAGIACGVAQVRIPKSASLPTRVIKQRTIYLGSCYMLLLSGSLMLLTYYLPLWFQTTQNVKPVDSGINLLPFVLSLSVAAVLGATITQRSGYYMPAMLLSPSITMVGEGLLTTFKPTTGSSHWIGYQFLAGFGFGAGMQTFALAIQRTLPKADVPTGMAIMFFTQQLGGAIFISVGQTVLSTAVISQLRHIPGLNAESIIKAGATELRHAVSSQFLDTVISAYNFACTKIFLTALVLSAAQLVSAVGMPWKSIKEDGESH